MKVLSRFTFGKLVLLLVLTVVCQFKGYAQQLGPQMLVSASSAGNESNVRLDWSIGGFISGFMTVSDASLIEGAFNPTFSVETLSVQDHEWIISVYPNPVRSHLTVDFPEPVSSYEILVFDLMGRIVYHEESGYTQTSVIDFDQLELGTYHLRLIDRSKHLSKDFKILKTK